MSRLQITSLRHTTGRRQLEFILPEILPKSNMNLKMRLLEEEIPFSGSMLVFRSCKWSYMLSSSYYLQVIPKTWCRPGKEHYDVNAGSGAATCTCLIYLSTCVLTLIFAFIFIYIYIRTSNWILISILHVYSYLYLRIFTVYSNLYIFMFASLFKSRIYRLANTSPKPWLFGVSFENAINVVSPEWPFRSFCLGIRNIQNARQFRHMKP